MKGMFVKLVVLLIALILCLTSALPSACGSNIPTISIEPGLYEAFEAGENFEVAVAVTDVTNLYGAQMEINFDPQSLSVVDESGEEVSRVNLGDIFLKHPRFVVQNNVDNLQGKIEFAASFYGDNPGFSGDGNIITFYFKTKDKANSEITFNSAILVQTYPGEFKAESIPHDQSIGKVVYPELKAQETDETESPGVPGTTRPSREPDGETEANDEFLEDEHLTDKEDEEEDTEKVMDFPDTKDHWANNDIMRLLELEIVSGDPEGTFRPDDKVRRDEFTKMIVMAGGFEPDETLPILFEDQAEIPAWAKEFIAAAVEAGIISGYNDNTFRAGRVINRAEIAVMAVKALEIDLSADYSLDFTDSNEIPQWVRPYIAAAREKGIISGFPDGSFRAGDPATRAQASRIICNLLDTDS